MYAVRHVGNRYGPVRRCGYTRTDGVGVDDAKTLEQCGFKAGDSLCVAVSKWSFRQEYRRRMRASAAMLERAAREAKESTDEVAQEELVEKSIKESSKTHHKRSKQT